MGKKDYRSTLIPFVTFVSIIIASALVIAYGRGYRLDIIKRSLSTTGLLAVTSDPDGAEVYIDEKLATATNDTVNLTPDWYTVRVTKEGFQPYTKRVRVQGEVVTKVDAFLFPTSPSLSVLSSNGVYRPTLSPDRTKLAFITPKDKTAETVSQGASDRPGIYVLDLEDKPLAVNRDARKIASSTIIDFSNALLTWSPTGKQIIATIPHPIYKTPIYYLLDTSKDNELFNEVTDLDALASEWAQIASVLKEQQLVNLKGDMLRVATTFAKIIAFSPEENKVLYEGTASAIITKVINPPLIGSNSTMEMRQIEAGKYYVYDIKEDRNYAVDIKTEKAKGEKDISTQGQFSAPLHKLVLDDLALQSSQTAQWLRTGRHLIIFGDNTIDVIEYDGTNRQTIYSGPFEKDFVIPWTNANKILILTNLNPSASDRPSLYSVNLR